MLASIRRDSRANGRVDTTRSCARRSLDAATIFIAFVICCVFFTARMRRRMSISEGMVHHQAAAAEVLNFFPNSSSAAFRLALISSSRIFFSTMVAISRDCVASRNL